MRLTSGPLGRGYAATATTIAKMHELVRLGVLGQHSLMLKGIVDQAIRHLPRRDYRAEAEALLQYVQRNVRYTRDAATADGVEVLQHPFVTLVQRSAGDCIPGRTLLLTAGYETKAMSDVCVGDHVIARDGRVAEVTQKWDKGMKKCLYFVLSNGSVLAATPDHKFFVDGKNGVEERRAGDVRVGEALLRGCVRPKPMTGFDVKKVEWARLCGYYAADGWYDVEVGGRIGIAGKDGHPKEAQKDWIVALCQRRGWKYYRHARYVRIDDQSVAQALHEQCGRLARGKRIPLSPEMTREELEALYEGLMADSGMQGDGHTRCYSTCSPTLAVQARILMHLLGYPCSIREVVNHGGFGRDPIYRVYENKRRARPIRVKEIHEGNVEHVYDIETTEGSFYLPESDVVVHNCDDLSVALATLYALAGFQYAFRTVGCGEDPLDFQHVYVVVYVPQYGWLAADPSYEEPLGWEPSRCGETVMRDGSTVAKVTTSKDWETG